MLKWTILTKSFFFTVGVLKRLTFSLHKDVENVDKVQQLFWAGKNKELTVPRVLLWPTFGLRPVPARESAASSGARQAGGRAANHIHGRRVGRDRARGDADRGAELQRWPWTHHRRRSDRRILAHHTNGPVDVQGASLHRKIPPPQGLPAFLQDGARGEARAGRSARSLPGMPDPRPWPGRQELPWSKGS